MPEDNETENTSTETSTEERAASSGSKERTPLETGARAASTETQKGENKIPQSRFNEVIGERDSARDELNQLLKQVETLQGQNAQLVGLLDQQKDDVALAANLRSLAATTDDQDVTKAIDLLDATLKGERQAVKDAADAKVEEGTLTRAEADALVEQRTAKLEESIDIQRAEMLFGQANVKAEKMLEGLPEEYLQEDVNIISEMWLNRVDWDGMDADPNQMDDFLVKSLQDTLDRYGPPRGAIKSKEPETETDEDGEPVEKELTAEEQLAALKEIDWAAVDSDGKPKYSEEEFSSAMRMAARLASQG